jgi:hypothetical protein
MTRYDNYVVVYRPKAKAYNAAGNLVVHDAGIRAEFSGPLHIFDSLVAQRTYRWTDEDRIELEKFLISSPELGVDFSLGFDQEVPKYLEEWMADHEISLGPNFDRRCGKVWMDGDDVVQCKNKAVPGKDFCGDHLPRAATQGIGSTAMAGDTLSK